MENMGMIEKGFWKDKKIIYKAIFCHQSYYEGIYPFLLCESDIDKLHDFFF